MIVSDVSVVVSNNNNTECSVDHLLSIIEERNAAVLDEIKHKYCWPHMHTRWEGGLGRETSAPQKFWVGQFVLKNRAVRQLYLKIIEGKSGHKFSVGNKFWSWKFSTFFPISNGREFSPTSGILSADPNSFLPYAYGKHFIYSSMSKNT